MSTKLLKLLPVFITSILLVLSFPKFDLGLLAWVALIPLLLVIKRSSPAAAFLYSYLSGATFMMGVCYWVNTFGGVKWIDFAILGLYLGLYYGLFGFFLRISSYSSFLPAYLVAPVLWVCMEYLRINAGFLAFPSALMAYSQYKNLPIIQISSITGAYGVSFLVVMVNAGLSELFDEYIRTRNPLSKRVYGSTRSIKFQPIFLPIAALGICFLFGTTILSKDNGGSNFSVSVVQGNISHEKQWDPRFRYSHLKKHIDLTESAIREGKPDLVVWPESSVQGPLEADMATRNILASLAKNNAIHMVVGTSQSPKFGKGGIEGKEYYNSAQFILPDGSFSGHYDKVRLVPFGEYIPARNIFPWPARYISRDAVFKPGVEYKIFRIEEIPFAVVICWESSFPDLVRRFAKNGAKFLVNITNESQGGRTAASHQALSMNVFRAVENKIAVVRAANTGISCFISPKGEVMGKVSKNGHDIFVEGYLTRELPLEHAGTFYNKYGDIFSYISFIVASVIAIFSFKNWMKSLQESSG
jgi:apolipoprotein N-acyltransferase